MLLVGFQFEVVNQELQTVSENSEIKVYEGNYSYYLQNNSNIMLEISPDRKEEKYKKHMNKLRLDREKKASEERKRIIEEIESKIHELENYKDEFESGMNENTTYDDYLDYQDKIKELDELYLKWEDAGKTRV